MIASILIFLFWSKAEVCMRKDWRACLLLPGILAYLSACSPTVKVEAPDKPITINMNIKIEHEIRVKVEKDLDNVLSDDSGLF